MPCYCNTLGSDGPECNSQGQCVCKPGVEGTRCDRCANGSPITTRGCKVLQQNTCFCSGLPVECSPAQGYSVHNITSTFNQGMEGWHTAIAKNVSPSKVQFHWSSVHQNLEVISKDVLPVYLLSPAKYLGNQVLSYGQTLSFTLRLDRGVRHPSPTDVILEGSGLTVSTSLGSQRTVIPCGRPISYTFRLNEQPSSKWKPQLSVTEFQRLLSNLTAIKIRATFGEDGHGHLDNVILASARFGLGSPAGWVQKCHCPAGYEGQFCERCAAGYRRRFSEQGVHSYCEPCFCQGGSCDPETGDCYSADETSSGQLCVSGYYSDPSKSGVCLKCPCPKDIECLVTPGTFQVKCSCPFGSTDSSCQKCMDGFYGDPLGESGIAQPCQRCQCNGHLDLNAVGNCDRVTGKCFKCLNNTTGFHCEKCLEGFYHRNPTDSCHACNCNPKSSLSRSCSDQGQCKCKKGFEGLRCERSTCPSCFNPVKSQIEKYVKKLQKLENLFNQVENSDVDAVSAMEKAVSAAEEMVQVIYNEANTLPDVEKRLQAQLLAIGGIQTSQEEKIQAISNVVNNAVQQDRQLQNKMSDIQKLIGDIKQNLLKAKQDIDKAEFPVGDAGFNTKSLSELVQKANDFANQHTENAGKVEQTAKSSLLEAEKALTLMNSVITGENKVKENVDDLSSQFETDKAIVNVIQKQAAQLTDSAKSESTVAVDTLKQISDLEKNLPKPLTKEIDNLSTRMDLLKDFLLGNTTEFETLQGQTIADQKEAEDLMNQLKTAQKTQDRLLDRANAAKQDADRAMQLVNNLGSVDQTLEKLRGFESQISNSQALANNALGKLPIINATIQKAVADNIKTQAVLDQLSDYNDVLDTLFKLNSSIARVEKMSSSLPPSSNLLKTASDLKGGMEGLQDQANSVMDKLSKEKSIAEEESDVAKQVYENAVAAYSNANHTRDAVGDALKTVNDLLGVLDTPGIVDEKKVAELEKTLMQSRDHVEQQLRPRLRELENRETQQRAAIKQMINDIDTILLDIENLEHIRRSIPEGCYNMPPIERP